MGKVLEILSMLLHSRHPESWVYMEIPWYHDGIPKSKLKHTIIKPPPTAQTNHLQKQKTQGLNHNSKTKPFTKNHSSTLHQRSKELDIYPTSTHTTVRDDVDPIPLNSLFLGYPVTFQNYKSSSTWMTHTKLKHITCQECFQSILQNYHVEPDSHIHLWCHSKWIILSWRSSQHTLGFWIFSAICLCCWKEEKLKAHFNDCSRTLGIFTKNYVV
jgi:hypothetical protein